MVKDESVRKSQVISTLETHDRLQEFRMKNSLSIQDCIESLIDQDPFDGLAFYVFCHKRELGLDERAAICRNTPSIRIEDIPSHRIIWQPRLKKPKMQTNSMLFKVNPKNAEEVKVIWILPEEGQWKAHLKGKMFEDDIAFESIQAYCHNPKRLEEDEPGDLTDEQAAQVLKRLYPNLFKT